MLRQLVCFYPTSCRIIYIHKQQIIIAAQIACLQFLPSKHYKIAQFQLTLPLHYCVIQIPIIRGNGTTPSTKRRPTHIGTRPRPPNLEPPTIFGYVGYSYFGRIATISQNTHSGGSTLAALGCPKQCLYRPLFGTHQAKRRQ